MRDPIRLHVDGVAFRFTQVKTADERVVALPAHAGEKLTAGDFIFYLPSSFGSR